MANNILVTNAHQHRQPSINFASHHRFEQCSAVARGSFEITRLESRLHFQRGPLQVLLLLPRSPCPLQVLRLLPRNPCPLQVLRLLPRSPCPLQVLRLLSRSPCQTG